MTISLGRTQNFWKESVSISIDIGQIGLNKGFDWPINLANKIVMYNTDQPSDIHGVYAPALPIPETDDYESFESMTLTDIIVHNGLMWLPAYTPGRTRFSEGKIFSVLILKPEFPRFNGESELLYLPVEKAIFFDAEQGLGFGENFGDEFGGPFGAEIKPYEAARFIDHDSLLVNYSEEDVALYRFKFDYYVQDDDDATVYVMQDYTTDGGKVVICDSIPIEVGQ